MQHFHLKTDVLMMSTKAFEICLQSIQANRISINLQMRLGHLFAIAFIGFYGQQMHLIRYEIVDVDITNFNRIETTATQTQRRERMNERSSTRIKFNFVNEVYK